MRDTGGTSGGCRDRHRRGFSLAELAVVMSVTLVLTGLMLPALSHVRENANRVVCSSNLRQIGIASILFADDEGHLPESFYARRGEAKREMQSVYIGEGDSEGEWEGLGHLWVWQYLSSPAVFYCPSHHGEHFFDRYEELFSTRPDGDSIYSNYHYAGDFDWEAGVDRVLHDPAGFVIATDGMRTLADVNHVVGMNVLRSDNSVTWRDDIMEEVSASLPSSAPDADDGVPDDDGEYARIWDIINGAF